MHKTHKCMKPQVLTVSKVSPGSNDPDKPWSKARFCFMKQLVICFGKLDPTIVLDPAIPNLQYEVIGDSLCIDIFLGGGFRTRAAPYIQQGDTKPIKGGFIPLVIEPFLFCPICLKLKLRMRMHLILAKIAITKKDVIIQTY